MLRKKAVLYILPVFAICISMIVLIGWILDIQSWLSIIPDAPTMKFNTAALFLFSGVAIYLLLKIGEKERKLISIAISFLALLTIFISAASLIEDLFAINLGIDQYFVKDKYSTEHFGRMSSSTFICFFLLGTCLFMFITGRRKWIIIANYLVTSITIIGLLALLTFFLQSIAHSNVLVFGSMAIHTAAVFILLTITLSSLYPHHNYLGLIYGNYHGSKLTRRLLPVLISFIVLLNYLLLYSINSKLLSVELGIALNTTLSVTIISLYLVFVFRNLNKQDQIRTKLELNIQKTNKELAQYKKAIDKSSIVVITDRQGIITYANEKFYNTTGYTSDEVIGKTNSIINSGFHSRKFFQDLWNVIQKGKVWVGGIKNKTKDGGSYWVHQVIIPLTDYENRIEKFLSIQQDITSQKILASQYEDVVNRNKELEQFTYIASHDLQEPIRSISGMTDLIRSQKSFEDEKMIRQSLEFIAEASARMKKLIKGLLDYALIGKSKERELVNIDYMVQNVIKDLSQHIDENSATIRTENLPMVYAFKVELRSLFQNLIMNAIKFRKKEENPIIEISVETDHDNYIFSIKDNGIGIEDVHTQSIFSIFKKLHKRSEYAGSGIGLAHCDKIVQLHGGSIWVESTLGVGSTFKFTIPNLQKA